jgi:hypothetical protein
MLHRLLAQVAGMTTKTATVCMTHRSDSAGGYDALQ